MESTGTPPGQAFGENPQIAPSAKDEKESWKQPHLSFRQQPEKNPMHTSPVDTSITFAKTKGGKKGLAPPFYVSDSRGNRCVFYFEEGNPHFVEAIDDGVDAVLPDHIEKAEKVIRRFWREVFSIFRLGTSIFVLFVVELVLFLTKHVARPLVLDNITAVSDHFLKPVATILFNMLIQPIFSFLWNILNSGYLAIDPLMKFISFLMTQLTSLLRAFRLVSVNTNSPVTYSPYDMEAV